MLMSPSRRYTNAAPALAAPVHGVVTAGGTHAAGSCVVELLVLKLRLPPVMVKPESNTTFPFLNSTDVPLPMLSPLPGQSTHQFPDTLMVPAALQLNEARQR